MSRLSNNVYIFSTANIDFGKIVACVDGSRGRAVGEDIFKYLNISPDESKELQGRILGYGKDNYVTVCGKERLRAVFFFKYLASDSSLCLALIPNLSATSVARALASGIFDGFEMSCALECIADKERRSLTHEYSDVRLHLSLALGQIMKAAELKLQHSAQSAEEIRAAAEGVAYLLGLSLEFETYLTTDDESLVATDEVFDGKFCAAALFVFAMIAAKCSADRSFKLTVVRGMGGVLIDLSFRKGRRTRLEALERLKASAQDHGIIFDVVSESDAIGIRFIPLYQDVGFLGVKNGEEVFDLIHYKELF